MPIYTRYMLIKSTGKLSGKMISTAEDTATSRLEAIAVLRLPIALIMKGARNMPMPEAVPITRVSTD